MCSAQGQSAMPLDNAAQREGWETRPIGYSVLTQGGSYGEREGGGV